MTPGKVLEIVGRSEDAVIKSLAWVVRVLAAGMVLLVCANVIGRYFFKTPVPGTQELIEMIMVVIAFFAIPYTALKQGHVRIDEMVSRFSSRTQAILMSAALVLGAGTYAVITYEASSNAINLAFHPEKMTMVLHIPFAPARAVMAFGCLLFVLKLLVDAFHPMQSEPKRKGDSSK